MDSESSSSSSDETPNHPLPLPEKDPPSVLPAVVPVMSDPLGVNLEDAIDADPLSLAHQDSIALSGEGKRGKSDSESSSSSGGTQATTGALGGTDIHVHLHVLPEIPGFEAGAAHLKEEIETVRHTRSLCIYTFMHSRMTPYCPPHYIHYTHTQTHHTHTINSHTHPSPHTHMHTHTTHTHTHSHTHTHTHTHIHT